MRMSSDSATLSSALEGKRVALVGLDDHQAVAIEKALERMQAFSRRFGRGDVEPGGRLLAPFDLLIVSASDEDNDPWQSSSALAQNDKPLLFVGPFDLLSRRAPQRGGFQRRLDGHHPGRPPAIGSGP